MSNSEELKLLDLIDITLLQELQDVFAKTAEISLITIDDKGPITKPSNYQDFKMEYILKNEEDYKKYSECYIKWNKVAIEDDKPLIYDCYLGLKAFVVPIIVEAKHIASIVGGQVITSPPDEEHFRNLARELGINEDEYIETLKKIKVIPLETLETTAKLIANQIYIAIKHTELFKRGQDTGQMEIILRTIIGEIRSSLNPKEIGSKIVNEIGKFFKADRVTLGFYDKKSKNYSTKQDEGYSSEYRSSNDIKSYYDIDFMDIKGFKEYILKEHLEGKDIIFEDLDEYLQKNNLIGTDIENFYREYGSNSLAAINIYVGNKFSGNLILTFENKRSFSNNEIKFLKAIADQAGVAFLHAKLYKKMQRTAINEKTLRKIILESVKSINIKEILNSIVIQTGKLFKADRCFFIEVNLEIQLDPQIKDYAEYLSSKDITSHIGILANRPESNFFINQIKKQSVICSTDVSKENLPEATKKLFMENLSIKSYMIVPVFYMDILYGGIILNYVQEYKEFSKDDIDMALAIANQSAIILHQAELYELTKIQTEKEKISKNIIEIFRTTLDKEVIIRLFVKAIGKFFNADRVLFSELDSKTSEYSPVDKNSEYLADNGIKSFIDYDWSNTEAKEYTQVLFEKHEILVYDLNEYLQDSSKNENIKNLFKNLEVKSIYSFPIVYQLRVMGFFSIEFIKEARKLTYQDIVIIRNICIQAGIALYHAELYEEAKKSVQNHFEFINKLSTELKYPLNMIIEFSEILLQHDMEREEEVKHLNTINTNAKKLLYFVDDAYKDIRTKLDFE